MHGLDDDHDHDPPHRGGGAGPLSRGSMPRAKEGGAVGVAGRGGSGHTLHDHGEDDDAWFDLAQVTEAYVYSGDSIELTTVGIDVGSSTSHLIFSRLLLRRLGRHLSSRYVVVSREVLHRSPILLTPYTPEYTIDAERLGDFVHRAYREAGLTPLEVDTGAIILTGEALKRTNARAIADLFASEAGKFVCASAGHNLEAVMAAHGSGAVAASREGGQTILNVDVGGGTSKLALVRQGEIVETASLEVGGRLVALDEGGDEGGRVTRIEPAARMVADALGVPLRLHEPLADEDRARIAEALADCLLAAIRREPLTEADGLGGRSERERTRLAEVGQALWLTPPLSSGPAGLPIDAITWSGGVSEYLYRREAADFGDLARPLAAALLARTEAGRLPAPVRAGGERIRATVIGASQFTVQVSGNTISISRPDTLPIHNLQVLFPRLPSGQDVTSEQLRDAIAASFRRYDLVEGEQAVALALDWNGTPSYPRLRALADGVAAGLPRAIAAGLPIVLVFSGDVGKSVGAILREDLGLTNDVISIDGIELQELDFVDVGAMLLPAKVVPVVIKSLVFPPAVDARAELAR
jgi:ethanolamine utilization protein EutA